MTTFNTITTSTSQYSFDNSRFNTNDISSTIATEANLKVDHAPKWGQAIDAMLKLRQQTSHNALPDEGFDLPSLRTIEAAIQWLCKLRDRTPDTPPTLIDYEPTGGLIIEHETTADDGLVYAEQLTLYNSGKAEMTRYQNNKVIELWETSFNANEA